MLHQVDEILDATDLFCPEPVMMLHRKMRDIGAGTLLQLVATDPSTQRDVPKFCSFLGHELVDHYVESERFYFYIRKQASSG